LLSDLSEVVSKVEASNDPAFGTTGVKLREALGSVERTSKWLLEKIASSPNEALAGATPYLRMFSTTLGGCALANEALAARKDGVVPGDTQRYVTLARFFAENVTVQSGALERAVIDSAASVSGADAVLVA
jgi:acyl-CoA dehydrogenase